MSRIYLILVACSATAVSVLPVTPSNGDVVLTFSRGASDTVNYSFSGTGGNVAVGAGNNAISSSAGRVPASNPFAEWQSENSSFGDVNPFNALSPFSASVTVPFSLNPGSTLVRSINGTPITHSSGSAPTGAGLEIDFDPGGTFTFDATSGTWNYPNFFAGDNFSYTGSGTFNSTAAWADLGVASDNSTTINGVPYRVVVTAIPEPSSFVCFGLVGAVAFSFNWFKRRQQTS